MKPVRIETWLLLVVMCVPDAICQDVDSAEEEPVTTDYFFNRDVNFVTDAIGLLPPGEEAENITQQVFEANTRIWFQKYVPYDEYIASCGGMSTSAKTIWQNSDYPRMEKLPAFCFLNLLPPAGTCALRIHFDDLNLLPAERNYYYYGDICPPSKPFFKASTSGDLTTIYCHKLDGYEGILAVSDTTEPTILLLQLDSSVQFQFKISVTAVNCNDIKTYESPSDCGIKNQNLATLRSELLGDLGSEQTQNPVVTEYGDQLPLAYRQRRRTSSESGSQSQDQKNKNRNKNKNSSNNNKKTGTETNQQKYKEIIHPLVEEFRKGIAAAEAAGKISKPNGNRVKGRQTTLVNEWPWIVLIEKSIKRYDYVYVQSCNGLLLDNSKVLTSRDCVLEYYDGLFCVENLSVRIGVHDLSSTTEANSKTVAVSKVTLPLKNTLFSQKDAFAILHLKEEVELSDTIRPICLPVSYNSFDDSGVVAGWEIDYGGEPNDPLPNDVKVKVLDQTLCKKALDDNYFIFEEDIELADVVCAENSKDGTGVVCYGKSYPPPPIPNHDIGKSLTQRDRRGAYYVTGVATSGIQECYYYEIPTIFSKIEPDNQFLNIALA